MTKATKKPKSAKKAASRHLGSSFEDFLAQKGDANEVNAIAIKRVIAWQLGEAMKDKQLSKNQMAREMSTSRSQLDRILDPENDRVQLDTLVHAANVLGRKLHIELV
jgi:DNA-binding Xre family transcriptional regulator